MITLSFSTINNCLQPDNSHNWINKQTGIPVPDRGYFQEGKDCHRIVQDHLAGIKTDNRLPTFDQKFTVETKDFDEKTHFVFSVPKACQAFGVEYPYEEEYGVHGYYDGVSEDGKILFEAKFSSNPWSLSKFKNSMQRKIYGLSNPNFEHAIILTGLRDHTMWDRALPKLYVVDFQDEDNIEAIHWIMDGIERIEKTQFDGGLEDGICTNPRCLYGYNCMFKE